MPCLFWKMRREIFRISPETPQQWQSWLGAYSLFAVYVIQKDERTRQNKACAGLPYGCRERRAHLQKQCGSLPKGTSNTKEWRYAGKIHYI